MNQKNVMKKAKKQELPDILVQLDESARAIAEGRIRRVR